MADENQGDLQKTMQIVLDVASMDLKIEADYTYRKLVSITKDTCEKANKDLIKGELRVEVASGPLRSVERCHALQVMCFVFVECNVASTIASVAFGQECVVKPLALELPPVRAQKTKRADPLGSDQDNNRRLRPRVEVAATSAATVCGGAG